MKCPICNNEMVQKNRGVLFATGFLMLIAAVLFLFSSWLWILSVLFTLVGGYLILWSTVGKGRWCRHCKRF